MHVVWWRLVFFFSCFFFFLIFFFKDTKDRFLLPLPPFSGPSSNEASFHLFKGFMSGGKEIERLR